MTLTSKTTSEYLHEDVEAISKFQDHHNLITLLDSLQHTVSPAPFYEIAETALNKIEELPLLMQCAMLAGKREPGGTYYRAKFWYKVRSLLPVESSLQRNALLSKFSQTTGLSMSAISEYIKQGETITLAEELSGSLRHLPSMTFHHSIHQKNRATEYLMEAVRYLEKMPDATPTQIHNKWCERNGSIKANLDIIKPSDWWAFSHPKWRREEDFSGSIPGEIYAHALYYFAPQQGVAVDPMAGSGMLKRVYDDRDRWQKDRFFSLEIHLFDHYPCRSFIKQHDVLNPLPLKADWIFLDPPYFGQSKHLFKGDLAVTADYSTYLSQIQTIVEAMALSLNANGRICIFLPKWSELTLDEPNYDIPGDVAQLAVKSGLRWIDAAFVSRARQQEQGSALKNIAAKRNQRMRSDTCVLNIFEKEGE